MDWTILFPIAIGLILAIAVVVVLVSIVRAIATWHHNNQQPVLQESVRLVAKRFATSGSVSSNSGGQVITRYYVTFEFLSGQRQEFSVRGRQYGMLAEGDKGVLTYQGTRYLGFERQLN